MIKVRFAPSPTGYLHIGNIRIALINYLFAKKHKGTFLLRIDDTDLERSQKNYEDAIYRDLAWLGITYDETFHQSDRFDRYREIMDKMIFSGDLYPCYETKEELDFKRKRQLAKKLPPIYDREGLYLSSEQKHALEVQGRRAHYRFKMRHDPIIWNDLIKGHTEFDGNDLSDPILIREDGVFLYSLCSVIDDVDSKVTHIIRGEDHVTNTASQIQMFETIGKMVHGETFQTPICGHISLLLDKDGGGLSKRLGSLSIGDLRQKNIEPMSINSMLARLGTSLPTMCFENMEQLVEDFDLDAFTKTSPRFDEKDLLRMNERFFHHVSYSCMQERLALRKCFFTEEEFAIIQKNVSVFEDFVDWFIILKDHNAQSLSPDDINVVKTACKLLPLTFSRDTWHEWTTLLSQKTGKKGKELYHPLRLALTGKEKGPRLEDLFLLLTRDHVMHRLLATISYNENI